MDSHESRGVVLSSAYLILHVVLTRYVSKVRKTIVGFDAVQMVNFIDRPVASHEKPRESVSGVGLSINHQVQIPDLVGPSALGVGVFDQSREDASLWIVVQQFAQALSRQFCHPFIFTQPFRAQALI